MRTYTITLLLGATIGLGLLLGCATDSPTNFPLSQNYDLPDTNSLNAVSTNSSSTPKSTQSLVTLKAGQDLAELVRKAPGVVLIDFYATWCGPCVKQGKILHELETYASEKKASIIKIDVDQHQDLASMFDVSSLPTMMLVKDGKIVDRQRGLANQTRVTELLSR